MANNKRALLFALTGWVIVTIPFLLVGDYNHEERYQYALEQSKKPITKQQIEQTKAEQRQRVLQIFCKDYPTHEDCH